MIIYYHKMENLISLEMVEESENQLRRRIFTDIQLNTLKKKFKKIHKNKKIMISGSFLFSKKYNDIDLFIFTVYGKKDYIRGNVHVNFLPETALESLFFSSISQISVSNLDRKSVV